MKKNITMIAITLASLSFVYTSCKKEDENKSSTTTTTTSTTSGGTTPTLYTRVGGTAMVADPVNPGQMIEKGRLTLRAVVDSSIFVIAADTQLQKYFTVLFAELGNGNTSGLAALSESFTDFMCFATGATNTNYAYTGRSMKDAHDPAKYNRIALKVNAADFDKFVADIGVGLAQNGVTAQNNAQLVTDLVALLNTTKSDIVQR